MLDRRRIRQLGARESATLDERTPASAAMFRRAERVLAGGWLFSATVDATEEVVLNALWYGKRTEGREGRVVEALPHDDVLGLLAAHRRLER
jgi:L-aminopeptidase/D-esterase-like protein